MQGQIIDGFHIMFASKWLLLARLLVLNRRTCQLKTDLLFKMKSSIIKRLTRIGFKRFLEGVIKYSVAHETTSEEKNF